MENVIEPEEPSLAPAHMDRKSLFFIQANKEDHLVVSIPEAREICLSVILLSLSFPIQSISKALQFPATDLFNMFAIAPPVHVFDIFPALHSQHVAKLGEEASR